MGQQDDARMRFFQLIRISQINDGTFGVFLDGKIPFCLTVERPWLDNRRNESCIPTGSYICRRVNSPKFGNTFEITNVEGRSEILFHKGNIMDDSHGCIVLGERYEPFKGKTAAVLSSGDAMKEFLERTEGLKEFGLILKEV